MADVINDLMIALRDRLSVTSVMVTHDMRSAYKVANQIAMLYNGSIIEVGTPDEIRGSNNPVVQQFIRGEASGPIQEGLPDRRVLSGWPLRRHAELPPMVAERRGGPQRPERG
jgi:ABC-type transporter Mla maintaining outer membrane lipid asymmetry ATPase subunit MlaF